MKTKLSQNNLKERKKMIREVCTETDGMTKMTKKTPTKKMKTYPTWTVTSTATIADTGMPSESIAPVMKKQITARQKENLKEKTMSKRKKEKTKIKTKLSLSLKKLKLNAHMHLTPADFVVELVVDFL